MSFNSLVNRAAESISSSAGPTCSVRSVRQVARFSTTQQRKGKESCSLLRARRNAFLQRKMQPGLVVKVSAMSPTSSGSSQPQRRDPKPDAFSGRDAPVSAGGSTKHSVTSLPAYSTARQLPMMNGAGLRILEDPAGDLWRFYCRSMDRHPLATKAVVMALGLALGDVLAKVVAGSFGNISRTLSMGVFGLLFQGPALHFLYKFLDAKVMPKSPTSPKAVLAKTAIDQLMFAPVATVAFLAAMELLSGSSGTIVAAVKSRFASTMMASYTIWPLALLINYAFCPPQHRIIFVNAVTILWSMILSMITL